MCWVAPFYTTQTAKGLSEENKKWILEAKASDRKWKEKTIASVPTFGKRFPIAMEYILIHTVKSTYEIIFYGWFFMHFNDMLVKVGCFSCSKIFWITSPGFELNGRIPGYNSQKQLPMAFCNKRLFFFKIFFLNCLIELYQ